jgi:hypothetical protein
MMRKLILNCSLLILCALSVSAQKNKPWTEWTAKEAEKVMNDSAWGQTQTESQNQGPANTSQSQEPASNSAITAVSSPGNSNKELSGKGESGEKKDPLSVHYFVRFMSAKPIRAAFVRIVELRGAGAEQVAQLRTFVDRDFGDYIVVAVNIEGNDRRKTGPAMQELMSASLDGFKGTTYLERKDGKRVALMEYRAPQDAFGAKFIFPRTVDGKPFIEAESGEVRFATELGKTVKIQRRFKVSDMMYEGKLEY